ncbi:hypothetical protein [Mesorhizobium cantuariense]|uniref:D-isomer specific 2-hydroxyacid dehydrogenase catalytic domain-containing protein n=1 Tax=Mesorhizobium cantuariense TaxID=1300275 RepID=A0ABV7MI01_9HYPH
MAELTIGFAHAAYRLRDEFLTRGQSMPSFEVRSVAELEQRVAEADVLVVSGLWRNELAVHAPKLRLIQSISAGTDQSRKIAIENLVRVGEVRLVDQMRQQKRRQRHEAFVFERHKIQDRQDQERASAKHEKVDERTKEIFLRRRRD